MKKYFLLTPGPTPVPHEVAQAEARPILHHRTSEFGKIFVEVIEGMKYIFQTKGDVLMVTGSGTAAMEASVVNLLSKDDEVIVASCGNFGDRWEKICQAYGVKVHKVAVEWGKAINPKDIEKILQQNKNIKAVFTTHTETSTGVVNNIEEIGKIVKDTQAVLVVDTISGLVNQKFLNDEWNVDVAVTGSQKGLMCPPGLSFVSVSTKAWQLVENSNLPKFYFDFKRMRKSIENKETPFTPAVSLVVAIHKAIEMIKEKTLQKIWEDTEKLAIATRYAIKSMGLKIFCDENHISNIVTPIEMPEGVDGQKVVKIMREEFGISIAGGQDKLKGKIVRIAHMGYIDRFDLVVGIYGLEVVLNKLGIKIPLGSGVKAFEEKINNL
ncbi:MAG: alanine--glyoxylate aminotransferase family protein [Elusimicrobiota bacterium]|nr:alanine--glyoxylate aminotransferase family protein [Endomicrobiia bacterium]MDW8164939.1 alanine--glyoxylate aminotransferase family protein [Elusimicrobiota bacterium]